MLISEEVMITADWSSISRYQSLGYGKMKQGDVFMIKVDHLKPNSTVIVKVSCDFCNNIFDRKYSEYVRNTKIQGKFSCKKCVNVKYKQTCLERYGVTNISKLKETHDKIKETSLKRYGVTSYMKTEKSKKENRERTLKNYGYDNVLKSPEVRKKGSNTCLERYGVENASQSVEIFSKQQQSRFEIRRFRNSNIFYQGSYERDFLEKYFDIYTITKPEPISYNYLDCVRVYHPDFYLPDFNLIVEIKSSYTFDKYKDKNIAKQKSSLENGFRHIFIINKNYQELELTISD